MDGHLAADEALPRRQVQWKVYRQDLRSFLALPGDVSDAVEALFTGGDDGATEERGRVHSAEDDVSYDVDMATMRILPEGALDAPEAHRLGRATSESAPLPAASMAALRRIRAANARAAGGSAGLRGFFGPVSPTSELERAEELRAAEQARRRADIRAMLLRARAGRRAGDATAARPMAPQEPWDCEACTLINQAGDLYCAVCGTPNREAFEAATEANQAAEATPTAVGAPAPMAAQGDEDDSLGEHDDPYEADVVTFFEALRMGGRPLRQEARLDPRPAGRGEAPLEVRAEAGDEGDAERGSDPTLDAPAVHFALGAPAPAGPPPAPRSVFSPSGRSPARAEGPRRGSIMSIFNSARALLRPEQTHAVSAPRGVPGAGAMAVGASPAARMRARLRSRSSSEGSTASESTSPTPTTGTSPADAGLRLRALAQRRVVSAEAAGVVGPPAAEAATPMTPGYTPLQMQLAGATPPLPDRSQSADMGSTGGAAALARLDGRGGRLLRSVELPPEEPAWEVFEWLADAGWLSFDRDASEAICAAKAAGRSRLTLHVEVALGNPRILSRGLTRSLLRPQTLTLDLAGDMLSPGLNGRFSGRPIRAAPGGKARALKRAGLRRAIAAAFADSKDVTEKIIAADPYAECSICLLEFEDVPECGGKDASGSGGPAVCGGVCGSETGCLRATQLRNCRGHAFHRACLEEWWQRMDVEKDDLACPTCTQVYVPACGVREN